MSSKGCLSVHGGSHELHVVVEKHLVIVELSCVELQVLPGGHRRIEIAQYKQVLYL